MSREEILAILEEVKHPAKGDQSLVALGMVKEVDIQGDAVAVTLAFPKRRDPLAEYLIGSARAALNRHLGEGVTAEVKTVVEEAPKPAQKNTLDLDFSGLSEVGHIIGIASGKGGVG